MNKNTMTKEYKKELGERLKEIRIKRNFTAVDVALTLGYSKGLFYGYEKGEREIPVAVALAFAKLMNVSLEYLFYGHSDDKISYEWIYKFDNSDTWTIHESLMTESQAKTFFENDNLKPKYKKTGREFYL